MAHFLSPIFEVALDHLSNHLAFSVFSASHEHQLCAEIPLTAIRNSEHASLRPEQRALAVVRFYLRSGNSAAGSDTQHIQSGHRFKLADVRFAYPAVKTLRREYDFTSAITKSCGFSSEAALHQSGFS